MGELLGGLFSNASNILVVVLQHKICPLSLNVIYTVTTAAKCDYSLFGVHAIASKCEIAHLIYHLDT